MENTMSILKQRARYLRINQTNAEKIFWCSIRARQLENKKFYRQFIVAPYIVDFVCRELMLIIELDGGQHMDNREQDVYRTRYLQNKGYKVVRFWNNQVINEFDDVLASLILAFSQRELELGL